MAHPLGKLLLCVDLLQADHLNLVRGHTQVLTQLLTVALSEQPGEGGDLQQVVLVGIATDHGGQALLWQVVEDFRDIPLLLVVKLGL